MSLDDVRRVFIELICQESISWNIMISGYANCRQISINPKPQSLAMDFLCLVGYQNESTPSCGVGRTHNWSGHSFLYNKDVSSNADLFHRSLNYIVEPLGKNYSIILWRIKYIHNILYVRALCVYMCEREERNNTQVNNNVLRKMWNNYTMIKLLITCSCFFVLQIPWEIYKQDYKTMSQGKWETIIQW